MIALNNSQGYSSKYCFLTLVLCSLKQNMILICIIYGLKTLHLFVIWSFSAIKICTLFLGGILTVENGIKQNIPLTHTNTL